MHHSRNKLLLITAIALTVAACGGDDAAVTGGGTVVISTPAEPDVLLPPLVRTTAGLQVVEQIFERLADLDENGSSAGSDDFSPRLASSWEWSADSLSITFKLNPLARWHDGTEVTARDVAYTLSLYKDPLIYSDAPSMSIVDSVSTPDAHTATFWYAARDPEQFYRATYPMFILPSHVLGNVPRAQVAVSPFVRNPIGTGPFMLAEWEPGEVIQLVADTSNYNGRPPLDRVVFSIAPDFTTAVTRVITGDADFLEAMQPPGLEEMKRNIDVRAIPYGGLNYAFVAFNFRDRKGTVAHPVLSDKGVRRAIAMAINRADAVANVFDSLAYVALGPFVRSMASADSDARQIPHDPARAAALLDSLGWRMHAGGEYRAKGGVRLEFGVLLPSTSRPRQRTAILAKEDLRKIGVNLIIEETDFGTFSGRIAARDFDSYYGAWQMTPSPAGIRQTWSPRTESGAGALNHGSYDNPVVGALIDSAVTEFSPQRRTELFQRAYQLITDDVAAIWMYEPRNVAAAHARLRIPSLPAQGWWTTIRKWSVDPDNRLPRDRQPGS